MKLIYLTPGIFNSGGTERVLSIKANYLVDVAGFEVIIITTDQKKRKCFFDFDKRIKHYDLGINFVMILLCLYLNSIKSAAKK